MRKNFLSVNWKVIDGAARQKKMLRLRPDGDGQFSCPVENCMHNGFRSARGLRKHIDITHAWYYYFDKVPTVNRDQIQNDPTKIRGKCITRNVPSFSVTEGIGADFHKWLQAPLGGGKNSREATQIAKRGMKFLLHVMGDDFLADSQAWADYIDCAIGSPSAVIKFMETITKEWSMSSSGALNYVKSICDLADFRKSQGVSDAVLRAFSVTDVYLRRGKENLQKKKVMEYGRNLDLESLIIKDSWSSLEEMEKVIPFHAEHYAEVYQKCADSSGEVTINDLAFASHFVATYLFLRVKCSRPRTFQYLTVDMVDKARTNGGFVNQTEFKTATTYMFDTLILNDEIFKILDMYISTIRPRMFPKCEFVLVSNTGRQYNSFTSAMTILVKQAIGKYVHPTRLRQIVETTSSERLSQEEQLTVSADQKHNSTVAHRSYKKRLSREVATKGRECMDKMLGSCRKDSSNELAGILAPVVSCADGNSDLENILATTTVTMDNIDDSVLARTQEILRRSSQDIPATTLSNEETTITDVVVTSYVSGTVSQPPPPKEEEIQDMPMWPSIKEGPSLIGSNEVVVTGTVAASSLAPLKEDNLNETTWPTSSQNIVDVKEEEEQLRSRLRDRKPTKKFSKVEDQYLIRGVQKYGQGHWGKIIKDTAYKFDKCRTRDSLRMRYGSSEVKRLVKEMEK